MVRLYFYSIADKLSLYGADSKFLSFERHKISVEIILLCLHNSKTHVHAVTIMVTFLGFDIIELSHYSLSMNAA